MRPRWAMRDGERVLVEGAYEEAKHPRGPGGKWVGVTLHPKAPTFQHAAAWDVHRNGKPTGQSLIKRKDGTFRIGGGGPGVAYQPLDTATAEHLVKHQSADPFPESNAYHAKLKGMSDDELKAEHAKQSKAARGAAGSASKKANDVKSNASLAANEMRRRRLKA